MKEKSDTVCKCITQSGLLKKINSASSIPHHPLRKEIIIDYLLI